MNFELIDNIFQISLLMLMAFVSFILSVKYNSRQLFILTCAYSCFSLGTLFWILCLAILGHVPHIFYVSEISWLSSYLFFMSLQIVRCTRLRVSFSPLPAFLALGTALNTFRYHMFGPAYFMSAIFSLTLGVFIYLIVYHFIKVKIRKYRILDVVFFVYVGLQMLVYMSSAYISDYTRFNLYFAIDISLTLTMASLLPLTVREVVKK